MYWFANLFVSNCNQESEAAVVSTSFTGHIKDDETGLIYQGARYYNGQIGRFTAQDPVSLAIGNEALMNSMTNMDLQAYLRKPQLHNSYSYAGNNPMKYVDKNGEFVFLAIPAAIYLAAEIGFTAYDIYDVTKTLSDSNSSNGDKAISVGGAALGIFAPGGGYGGLGKGAKSLVKNSVKAPNISISNSRLQHITDRHTLGGSQFKAGKTSYFNDGVDVKNLIQNSVTGEARLNDRGFYEHIVDVGQDIGVDRVSGRQTSVMSVITDKKGNVVTAHPGKPSNPDKRR